MTERRRSGWIVAVTAALTLAAGGYWLRARSAPAPSPPERAEFITPQAPRTLDWDQTQVRELGHLDERVLGRLAPPLYEIDGGMQQLAWPASTLGRLRVLLREESALLLTEGLSDPWSADLWGEARAGLTPLAFELALELTPAAPSVDAVANVTWASALLFRLADQLSYDTEDLNARVERFGAATYRIEAPKQLSAWHLDDGTVPLLVTRYRAAPSEAPLDVDVGGHTVHVLALRLLRENEYFWALEHGNTTGVTLERAFLGRPAHVLSSWEPPELAPRPSVLDAIAR